MWKMLMDKCEYYCLWSEWIWIFKRFFDSINIEWESIKLINLNSMRQTITDQFFFPRMNWVNSEHWRAFSTAANFFVWHYCLLQSFTNHQQLMCFYWNCRDAGKKTLMRLRFAAHFFVNKLFTSVHIYTVISCKAYTFTLREFSRCYALTSPPSVGNNNPNVMLC